MQEHSNAFTEATGRDLEGGTAQPNYRRYQLDLIAPHCGRSVLEVGAGLGEFSSQLTGLERLVVTDLDPGAVEVMRTRFTGRDEVAVGQLDVDRVGVAGEIWDGPDGRGWQPVDSLVAINVLEHIGADDTALRGLARLVRPGGRLVIWVPGYQQLYGDFDRKVGHVRRYTPRTLTAAMERAGLVVELAQPVNLLGGLAWWAAVRRGGAGSPNPRLVTIYDRVVIPVTRLLERFAPVPFGQSVLGVARRRVEDEE